MEKLKKQEDFTKYFQNPDELVIFKFSAKWCGPCRVLGQTINNLTKEELGDVKVVEIDVDDDFDDLCSEYNIASIPVLLFMKDGMVLSKKIGAISKHEFLDTLNKTRNQ